jgi:hypothetical protein
MVPALPRPAPDELAAAFAELRTAAPDERGISGVAG